MSKCFTVVFDGDVKALPSNPMKFQTLFGPVLTISYGDKCSENDRLRAQNAELVEALLPFACECSEADACKHPNVCRHHIARAAIAKAGGESSE